MATERHPKHGEEGYEHADANVRSIYRFGAVLAILIRGGDVGDGAHV